MARTILVKQTGTPDVMQIADVDPGVPGPGQIRLRQTAIGVNFVDVHYRRGSFQPTLPLIPGAEAVGIVEATGAGVEDLRPGDRVAYGTAALPPGSYTEARLLPAEYAVKVPSSLSDEDVAASLFKGITAHGMFSVRPVNEGDIVLVQAAAGGVGTILVRWAKHFGAKVIGSVGSNEKIERARQQGCDHVLVYADSDFPEQVQKLTDGRGVDVLYDGIGEATFPRSVDYMAMRAMMISFGEASGKIPPFDLGRLNPKSLSLTKYSVRAYVLDPVEYRSRALDVLKAIEAGIVPRNNYKAFTLADAAMAHRELEGRKSVGSLILRT